MTIFQYGPNAYALPDWVEQRLSDYCTVLGIPISSIYITSTFRTPEDQARIMYENYSLAQAQALYSGAKGRQVTAAWAANETASKETIVTAMAEAMRAVGFQSNHMDIDRPTVDIAPSHLAPGNADRLVNYANSRKAYGEVAEVLGPASGDHAVHIAFIPPTDLMGRAWELVKIASGVNSNPEGNAMEDDDTGSSGGGVFLGLGLLGLAVWLVWG